MKKENGVTLLVLIVTVVLMLIISGITLNTFTGENMGIFQKLKQKKFQSMIQICKDDTEVFVKKEKLKSGYNINNITTGNVEIEGITFNSNYCIDEIIKDVDAEFLQKLVIYHGELFYNPLDNTEITNKEIEWAENLGVRNINDR